MTEKRKRGRPKANIDWQYVGRLAEAGASGNGIAAVIGIDEHTLRNRCVSDNNCLLSEFLQQKKAKGEEHLRNKQYEVAMGGNVPMLIWVGKNRLGQSDKQEVLTDPAVAKLKEAIATRAQEKGISVEEELQNYVEHYAPPPIKEKLISELSQ